ncbi:MAG: DUF3300 domain-containing protein [Desulfobulbaceae bacterium]|uniref:DUF3300 domain-containing protein n=1 Tax=Candidatus Desulfobia pelagia TaxID=2841692 RepID=A0A8J6NDK0_9BACT|nr:DUF3300 domain-containing protein [Candidatus Desulfobia pelagia]
MKAVTIFHLALGLFVLPFFVAILSLAPPQVHAQDSDVEFSDNYSREELAQMLAPIALYPDALLSQILMAATYPIEVIEADRWVRRNPQLKDEALDAALLDKDWEPSIKAICYFPSILALMSERVSETTSLGNAFLAQEAEVMGMVQELRAEAYAQGNLASTSKQKVIVERETIIIEPADPRVIYVPYYDPFSIYGSWWYPAYRPYYWGPPGVSVGIGISYWPGFYFGFSFGTWSYFDWHNQYIYIDVHKRPRYVRHDRWRAYPGRWDHAPIHRRGVAFRDKYTARKYGQYPHRSREFRSDTRGFPERRDRDNDRVRRLDDRTRNAPDRRGDDSARLDRERSDREKQMRKQADRDKKERQRVERENKERAKGERGRQEQERVERDQQMRERLDQEKRVREPVDGGKTVQKDRTQSRESVFNRVDSGGKEYQSSERGRASRQGRAAAPRGRGGHSDDDDRGGRNDWGRSRR